MKDDLFGAKRIMITFAAFTLKLNSYEESVTDYNDRFFAGPIGQPDGSGKEICDL
jgi:hypothetical protein